MRPKPAPPLIAVLALSMLPSGAWATGMSRRVAERGPATLVVGTLFTITSPPSMLVGAVRGQPIRPAACRLGHGIKMVGASALAFPAGLILAPLHPSTLPAAWLDGVVDAFQEDYFSRPFSSVLA